MLIGVFELLADAREQIASVNAAIEAQRDFWLAEAASADWRSPGGPPARRDCVEPRRNDRRHGAGRRPLNRKTRHEFERRDFLRTARAHRRSVLPR